MRASSSRGPKRGCGSRILDHASCVATSPTPARSVSRAAPSLAKRAAPFVRHGSVTAQSVTRVGRSAPRDRLGFRVPTRRSPALLDLAAAPSHWRIHPHEPWRPGPASSRSSYGTGLVSERCGLTPGTATSSAAP
jgi:hypothetical protein